MHTMRVFASVGLCALAASGMYVLAGPLTPPPGPVASTPGPEPRRSVNDLPGDATALHVIREGGSYFMTANIANIDCISPLCGGIRIVTNEDVSIDGMGFSLVGGPQSGIGIEIVDDGASDNSVQISNVVVRGWDVGVQETLAPGPVVRTHFRGGNMTFRRVVVTETRVTGVLCCRGAGLHETTIVGNFGDGAVLGDGSEVVDSEISGNDGAGVQAGKGLVLKGSKILQNFLPAIQTGADAIIEGNHIGGGLTTGQYVRFANNVVSLDLDDTSSGPVVFNGGLHQIKDNEFNMHVLIGLLLPAVQALGDDVSMTGNRNLIVAPDMLGQVGVRMPPHFTTFDGLRHHYQGNSFHGIPAGTEALLAKGESHVINGNSFVAREEGAQGIIGDATRSAIFGNTFMNMQRVDAVVLNPQLNFIGPILDPAGAAQNCSPERNLVISIPPLVPQ